jgi:GWxTD domain-containing protein
MKKTLFLILISFYIVGFGQKMNVYYYQSAFWSPTDGEYVEIYFTFTGKNLRYIKNEEKIYNAELSVLITYSQNNEIKKFQKYNIKSPDILDTSFFKPNFIDLQRFVISPGKYKLEIAISDINNASNTINFSDSIFVKQFNKTSFSDIELLESFTKSASKNKFTKNGYDITPYVSDYYPSSLKSFNFYSELYLLDSIAKNEKVLLKYYIEPENRGINLDHYTNTQIRIAEKVNVLMGNFDISNLPTGNYNLVVECINKQNEIITSNKVFFQRNNKTTDKLLGDVKDLSIEGTFIDNITNLDTLNDYIRCLFPLMEYQQINFALKQLSLNNVEWMQKFFYGFWKDLSPLNPEGDWLKYRTQVLLVNKNFSTQIKKGYETDRGRIYLRYGSPNNIIKRDMPVGVFPYEMWHYISTRNEGNVKVVFYNKNGIRNDYELLYTDLRGESSDPNWKSTIQLKVNQLNNSFGTQIDEDFNSL